MALSKGVNSYGTVAEADAYLADKLDIAAWSVALPEDKEKALVTATRILDSITWRGYAISISQPLAFPRVGDYFDPRLGQAVVFDAIATPSRIINACFELAYHLLNNDGLLDSSGSVKSLSIGQLNISGISQASLLPKVVKDLIRPIELNQGTRRWWRAN